MKQMRRLLLRHRWATYLVAGLVLFATSGTTLSRMTCLMGGHSVWSLGAAADCCPEGEAHEGASIKALCCELSQAKAGVSAALPSVHQDAVLLADVQQITSLVSKAVIAPVLVRWLDTRPPPRDVSGRLAELRTHRI